MAQSAFGDSLFDEFEREAGPSDKILRQKFKADKNGTANFEDDGNESVQSYSEEDWESETESAAVTVDQSVAGMLSELRQTTDIQTYKKENKTLKDLCHLVREKVTDEEGPAIQVIYMNHRVSRKYRAEIEGFINSLIESERTDGSQLPILQKRPNAKNIAIDQSGAETSEERMRKTRAATVIGCGQMYNEFMLDSMGWPLVEYNTQLTDGWDLPYYPQVFENPLPCDSESDEEDEGLKRPSRQKATCWNCGSEEHNLAGCPNPRDQRRINQSRMEFQSQSSQAGKRYTMDSLSSKYDKMRPGVLSDKLRQALGLSKRTLPPFTYQMRIHGYPPGWLKEAELETSGISMFDKHGKEVADAEQPENEEGEVTEMSNKKMLNPNKLVAFPGFNVPIEKEMIDEHEKYNMPAMQPNQQLDVLRAFLSQQYTFSNERKRRRDRADTGEDMGSSAKKRREANSESDMDISGCASPDLAGGSRNKSRSGSPATTNPSLQRKLAPELDQQAAPPTPDKPSPPLPPTPERPPLPLDTPPVTPTHGLTPGGPPLPVGTPPVTPSTPIDGVFRTPHGITPLSSLQRSGSIPMADLSADGKATESGLQVKETSVVSTEIVQDFSSGETQVTSTLVTTSVTTESEQVSNNGGSNPEESANEQRDIASPNEIPGSDINSPEETNNTIMSETDAEIASCPDTPASIPLSRSSSLSQSFGTPVIEGVPGTPQSEGKQLPSASKFADGITEHLPFENLPNSTGKYQAMKKLLSSAKKYKSDYDS